MLSNLSIRVRLLLASTVVQVVMLTLLLTNSSTLVTNPHLYKRLGFDPIADFAPIAMVAHAGQVLTHRYLLKEIWGGETDVQYLRIYIRSLRQKIEPDPANAKLLITEAGGYRLQP